MNMIIVTCAIIVHKGKILCAQRSSTMSHPLLWEFPGGKTEPDETLEQCMHREISEELNIGIEILEKWDSHIHTYGENKILELVPFLCKWTSGKIEASEHANLCWLNPYELEMLDWTPADLKILPQIYSSVKKVVS